MNPSLQKLAQNLATSGIHTVTDDEARAAAQVIAILRHHTNQAWRDGIAQGLRQAAEITHDPALYAGAKYAGEDERSWKRRALIKHLDDIAEARGDF